MKPKTKKQTEIPVVSPWMILNKWLVSEMSQPVPQALIDSKKISQHIILYHFQYCDPRNPYLIFLNNIFNNYSLYEMPLENVLMQLKKCVKLTGFKAPFIEKMGNEIDKSKVTKLLKRKFFFLKLHEISLLVKNIDLMEEKDSIYETLGAYVPKKRKATAEDKKKLQNLKSEKQVYSLKKLMENFSQ